MNDFLDTTQLQLQIAIETFNQMAFSAKAPSCYETNFFITDPILENKADIERPIIIEDALVLRHNNDISGKNQMVIIDRKTGSQYFYRPGKTLAGLNKEKNIICLYGDADFLSPRRPKEIKRTQKKLRLRQT